MPKLLNKKKTPISHILTFPHIIAAAQSSNFNIIYDMCQFDNTNGIILHLCRLSI